MARNNFTKKAILDRFAHCKGLCEACGTKLLGGDYHADHDLPDRINGKNTFENCRILCIPCHKLKTKTLDQPRIAKTKRQEWKNNGPKKKSKFGASEPQNRATGHIEKSLPRRSIYQLKKDD